jgi:hypothetical protein
MQDNYVLWQAKKPANLSKVRKFRFGANAWRELPVTVSPAAVRKSVIDRLAEFFAKLSEQCKSRPRYQNEKSWPYRGRLFHSCY